MSNRADLVETLLVGEGRAIDPNCRVANARVPLSLAASRGLYDVSTTLLAHGADPARRCGSWATRSARTPRRWTNPSNPLKM